MKLNFCVLYIFLKMNVSEMFQPSPYGRSWEHARIEETRCFCFPDQIHFTTWSCFSWKWLGLLNSVLWACARHTKLFLTTSIPIGLRHRAAYLTKQQKEAIIFREAQSWGSIEMLCVGCSGACRLWPLRQAISSKLFWQLHVSILLKRKVSPFAHLGCE